MIPLNRWLRSLRPRTKGERALETALESVPATTEAIHLEEVGLPNGKTTTIQWLLSGTSAISRIDERADRSAAPQWQVTERDEIEFHDLMNSIHELDSSRIKNFTAPMRDGVVYFIAWGAMSNVRSVTLRNPHSNSDQKRLVMLITSSVSEK